MYCPCTDRIATAVPAGWPLWWPLVRPLQAFLQNLELILVDVPGLAALAALVPSMLPSLTRMRCCGRCRQDAWDRALLRSSRPPAAGRTGESDCYAVSGAGEGSVRGVIGPHRTMEPTNDAFTVASSAVVPPENVAPSKVVCYPENVAPPKLAHFPEKVAWSKPVYFPENVASPKLVHFPENVAL